MRFIRGRSISMGTAVAVTAFVLPASLALALTVTGVQ